MNTHELAETLLKNPPADIHLFGGYTGDENQQMILLPWRVEYSKDEKMAVIIPDLPEQVEGELKGLDEALKEQGELPPIDEETVQQVFTEFELQRAKTLHVEWEKEESPDRPPFASLIYKTLITEEKIEEINKHNGMPNDRKFWAYVIEAYVLNVIK